jgi:hypothetical protein
MAHIKRIDEMNTNGYKNESPLSDLFLWLSNAIGDKLHGDVPHICIVSQKIMGEIMPAINRFSNLIDEEHLDDIIRRGNGGDPLLWDTEKVAFPLTPEVVASLCRIADKGIHILIVVKDENAFKNLLKDSNDAGSALRARSIVILG